MLAGLGLKARAAPADAHDARGLGLKARAAPADAHDARGFEPRASFSEGDCCQASSGCGSFFSTSCLLAISVPVVNGYPNVRVVSCASSLADVASLPPHISSSALLIATPRPILRILLPLTFQSATPSLRASGRFWPLSIHARVVVLLE